MILVDTSIWIDHFRGNEPELAALLHAAQVLTHPFIVGEIALGYLRQRAHVLASLNDLPSAVVAGYNEVLAFIERGQLAGSGIGYLDAHLLAAVRWTQGARLWTRDKRLLAVAEALELSR